MSAPVQGGHLWKQAVVFEGLLSLVVYVSGLHVESDQLEDEATPYSRCWQHRSHLSFFSFFFQDSIKHFTLLGFLACLQVVGDQEDDDNQGGRRRQETSESWQPAATGGRKQHRPHPHPSEQQAGWFRQEASGQHYADHTSANVEPTDEELNDLSVACNRLWELDLNRLTPGQDYKIDCGEGKKLYNREDMSGDSLFQYLDQGVFQRPTYARFYNLLDNYHADESSREQLTSAEQQEQAAFIEEISRTAPIKYLLKYLAAKRILPGSMEQFKEALQTLWFKFYGRGGTRDASSAFEHVFVGEIKRTSEVSGFHNWIQVWP